MVTLLVLSIFFISCGSDDEIINDAMVDDVIDDTSSETSEPNILLIIADDMGLDATNGYSEGSVKPNTPHLDSIMNAGLKFNNVWVNPTCSPTRGTIITGKYGHTTGVLTAGDDLTSDHTILPAYINEQTGNKYATGLVGKWHLALRNTFNPETLGIDYYAGLLSGATGSYTSWDLAEDGVVTTESTYITEKFTDLAKDWVTAQSKPWFLWLAYTAPHTPFHLPPDEMHSQGALPSDAASIDANPLPYYMASIEAMDYQIGKLLNGMSVAALSNTVIIFIGDNGTPGQVAQAPYSRTTAKGSIYQGGINVPMFISGPSVMRTGTEEALINGTDLFATIAGIAGVNVQTINDSHNFQSLFQTENQNIREYIYSEVKDDDSNKDDWCIRNSTYKLIEFKSGTQEFYNLISDPYESDNLISKGLSSAEATIKSNMEVAAAEIRK